MDKTTQRTSRRPEVLAESEDGDDDEVLARLPAVDALTDAAAEE